MVAEGPEALEEVRLGSGTGGGVASTMIFKAFVGAIMTPDKSWAVETSA